MKKLLVVGEKSITQPVVPASVTGYQAGFLDLRQPWRTQPTNPTSNVSAMERPGLVIQTQPDKFLLVGEGFQVSL